MSLGQLYNLDNIIYFKNESIKNLNFSLEEIQTNSLEIERLSKELLELGEVKKLLIQLKNSKMFEKKDFILKTINTALSDVFNDQNVRIDLVASNTNQEASKLNIKYDIVLYQNNMEMARNEKLLICNGGGVISFISILFKILVGYIYSKNKFFIFDESLAEVSEIYRPRLAQFIRKFCEAHDFTIIIITQTSDIAEFANLVYYLDGEFENGISTLKIESVDGDYPKENYIYTEIENFQSIKKIEFRYKGFTAIIGKNNIGKSASFRAVNSILFNNFDMKAFPRMLSSEKPDKLLNTFVEFGKYFTDGDPRNEETKISFRKKGQSIIWNFNDMEFVGKNLAFDKVKEKVEEIGFKYLRLKDQYKNFKGNLKEQTERLAITTQQDGYYLIGGKASDTSKVFDFLFDSREVTLALVDLNNDILSFESKINSLTLNNAKLKNTIEICKVQIKKFDNLYKQRLIQDLILADLDNSYKLNYVSKLDEYLIKVDSILELSTILWRSLVTHEEHDRLVFKDSILNQKIEKIEKLVDLYNKMQFLINYKKSLLNYSIIDTKVKLNFNKIKEYNILLFNCTKMQFDTLNSKFHLIQRLIYVYTSLIDIGIKRVNIETYFNLIDTNEKISTRSNWLNFKTEKIGNLILAYQRVSDLTYAVENLTKLTTYFNKLNIGLKINDTSMKLYDNYIRSLNIQSYLAQVSNEQVKINKKQQQIYLMDDTIKNLPQRFNLEPCGQCGTHGFIEHIH